MNTVFSNIANAKITAKTLNKLWMELFQAADEVTMATGYVSNDAVKELHKILEHNHQIKKLDLFVGMHYLEGFTRLQYDSLCELNQFLQEEKRGEVFVSPFVKFHGKMYAFKNNKNIDCLIGSANLTCFWDSTERTYETMLHLDDVNALSVREDIQCTIKQLGVNIQNAEKPISFKEHNTHLENCIGVSKVDLKEVAELFLKPSEHIFHIPAKTEEKSNLNVFFGKGRITPRGFIQPRPWYEVEIIVSKDITTQAGYPLHKSFDVITDDGWKFSCKTSGDYSKNLRSENDLKTLGKWIKGRLESANCLKTGEAVTEETLKKYGNHIIELRSTDNPDIWLLSFKGKN